ncbi:MAG TPA: aromatic acid exporter family protein [Chondromyces sp.]|nr:aromatic acid exporter family protein [Chondromyces sp.]
MKLGARILKTGIAIVLALLVSQLLGLPSPVFAGIAAVFAVQPNIYRSYLTIIEQIQANIIGATLAIVFVLLFGNHILIVGLAAIIAIMVMLKLKLDKAIGLALVTLIAIMEVQNDDFIQFSLIRFSTIMLGVFSSFIVNLIFLPPKYETRLFHHIESVTEDTLKWIRLSSRNASDAHLLKKDIGKIKEKLLKIDNLFLLYKEDRTTRKKSMTAKNRKLVLYRQMISTTRKSVETLKRLNQFDNEIQHLDDQLLKILQEKLDSLTGYHEHLLLRFIHKVNPETETEELFDISSNREDFMNDFFEKIESSYHAEQEKAIHLIHILSSVLEYGEHLTHLDQLISSFHKYHKDDEQTEFNEDEE